MTKVQHKDSHTRFNSVDWFGDFREITIGGVGTIGSWLSLLLARTGEHELIMYDDDQVESINLSGQLFSKDDVGRSKTDSARDNIFSFTEISDQKVHSMNQKLTSESYVSAISFSCFDNMKARKEMFNKWKTLENRELFIDGRMTIETYEVYVVKKGDEKRYEQTLFDDSQVAEQICSLKNTSHTGALIAARMVTSFTNHIANGLMGIDIREVPFHFREDMQLQLITMECQQK